MNYYEEILTSYNECPRCGESGIEHLISYSHCLNCGYSQFGSHDKCLEHNYFKAMQLEHEFDRYLLENELPGQESLKNKKAI